MFTNNNHAWVKNQKLGLLQWLHRPIQPLFLGSEMGGAQNPPNMVPYNRKPKMGGEFAYQQKWDPRMVLTFAKFPNGSIGFERTRVRIKACAEAPGVLIGRPDPSIRHPGGGGLKPNGSLVVQHCTQNHVKSYQGGDPHRFMARGLSLTFPFPSFEQVT